MRQLNGELNAIRTRIRQEVGALAASTHAFVVKYAQDKLKGWRLTHFLGEGGKNVRWSQISENIWVVEIDPAAEGIEDGSDSTFMGKWLLRPGDKGVKRNKRGELYRVIPMTEARGKGGKFENSNPALAMAIKNQLKREKISLNKIETDANGAPKLGVLHKLKMDPPGSASQYPEIFSMPRTKAMSALTGLRQHEGIFHLAGLAVTQRQDEKGKVFKEATVFRVIHEKHEMEGRWFAPKQEGLHSLKAASEYAATEWERIMRDLQQEMGRR